jgi:hypothetical protein
MKKSDDDVRPFGRPAQSVAERKLDPGAPILTRIYLPETDVMWIRERAALSDRSTTREIIHGVERYLDDHDRRRHGRPLPRPDPPKETIHTFISAKLPVNLIARLDERSGDVANRKLYLTQAVMWWLRQKEK